MRPKVAREETMQGRIPQDRLSGSKLGTQVQALCQRAARGNNADEKTRADRQTLRLSKGTPQARQVNFGLGWPVMPQKVTNRLKRDMLINKVQPVNRCQTTGLQLHTDRCSTKSDTRYRSRDKDNRVTCRPWHNLKQLQSALRSIEEVVNPVN